MQHSATYHARFWRGNTAKNRRATRRLEYIDLAKTLNDLKVPPSNQLHASKGDREGQYSISINEQWRICFRFTEGDAYDVETTDYR